MTLSHKAYQRLLRDRKSRRAFSATATVSRKLWRGFLEDAANPLFKKGVTLPAAGTFSNYEIFLLAQRLSGVKRGIYHVCASKRRAVRLERIALDLELLQEDVCWSTQGNTAQAALVIAADGTEYREKYGKRGFELLHQNLGVVQLHLYLTATAWELAGCAIGWLDHRLLGKSFPWQRGDAVVGFTFGL